MFNAVGVEKHLASVLHHSLSPISWPIGPHLSLSPPAACSSAGTEGDSSGAFKRRFDRCLPVSLLRSAPL